MNEPRCTRTDDRGLDLGQAARGVRDLAEVGDAAHELEGQAAIVEAGAGDVDRDVFGARSRSVIMGRSQGTTRPMRTLMFRSPRRRGSGAGPPGRGRPRRLRAARLGATGALRLRGRRGLGLGLGGGLGGRRSTGSTFARVVRRFGDARRRVGAGAAGGTDRSGSAGVGARYRGEDPSGRARRDLEQQHRTATAASSDPRCRASGPHDEVDTTSYRRPEALTLTADHEGDRSVQIRLAGGSGATPPAPAIRSPRTRGPRARRADRRPERGDVSTAPAEP